MARKQFLPGLSIDAPSFERPLIPESKSVYEKEGTVRVRGLRLITVYKNVQGQRFTWSVCTDVGLNTDKPIVTTAKHAAEQLKLKLHTEPWLHCAITMLRIVSTNVCKGVAVTYIWDTRKIVDIVVFDLPNNWEKQATLLRKVPVRDNEMPLDNYEQYVKALLPTIKDLCSTAMHYAETATDWQGKNEQQSIIEREQLPIKSVTEPIKLQAFIKNVSDGYLQLLHDLPAAARYHNTAIE